MALHHGGPDNESMGFGGCEIVAEGSKYRLLEK